MLKKKKVSKISNLVNAKNKHFNVGEKGTTEIKEELEHCQNQMKLEVTSRSS